MQFKRATPVLGIAAAVALAVIAFQFIGAPTSVGDAEPTPRLYTREDLNIIPLTEGNVPDGVEVTRTVRGRAALVEPLYPGGETVDTSEFVDAISTELHFADGGYVTWAALFETQEAAIRAFDFLVGEHESADGWDLDGTTPVPPLGDESVVWTGQQYNFESAQTLFWRQGNLLLAVVGWHDWTEDGVREIADDIANRAD